MLLKLIDLTVGYGAFAATHEISISLEKGSVFALVGANGAGKSSTIMSIGGHVEVLGGCIEFDGADITGMPVRDRVRAGIAVAPEGRRLFTDLSVRDNLALGGYVHPKSEEAEALERVVELFPRLKERLTQRAGTLSGGEQQMLAIGRGLMTNPDCLLMDEPSEGLAPIIIEHLWDVIGRLREEGLSILLVEQNVALGLKLVDYVHVISKGQIVHSSGPQALWADEAVKSRYLGIA